MSDVLAEVAQERDRQDAKWGQQNHSPAGWLAVLVEEVGEAAQQIAQGWVEPITGGQRDYSANLRRELIQVAASAVAFIECLDRQDGAS